MTSPRVLHPVLSRGRRRQLFFEGIELFNRGELFACHEAWEEIWRSTTPEPKDLFQGLIQVGIGLYHFHTKKRPDVALRVLTKGQRRLTAFAPESHGLDVARLLDEVDTWRAWLAEARGHPPKTPRLRVVAPEKVC